MILRTPLKHSTKPIRRNSPLKRSINAIKRSPLKRNPRKQQAADNPEYLSWLRTWPCFVCLKQRGIRVPESDWERGCFRLASELSCGTTQAAHVGLHGMGRKCPDRETMPLGEKHHLHATAGGGPESHHTLGKAFWKFHGIDRDETLALLHRLYREETGLPI